MSKLQAYIALLRGINVGGKNKLPMEDLLPMFQEEGCENVRNYIQSGNILFLADKNIAAQVSEHITKSIRSSFGYDVPVILRSAKKMTSIASTHPLATPNTDPKNLHVVFLKDKVKAPLFKSLDPQRSPSDSFLPKGQEIYLLCPQGIGRSKLTIGYFEKTLQTQCTIRNWKTVLKLHQMTL